MMNRYAAIFSITATLMFLVIVITLLFLAPDVNPLRSGISFYALAGYRLVIGFALALIGIAAILLAVCLWPGTASTSGRVGLVLLSTWGITSILAGAFPLDAPGGLPTLSGSIHNLAGLNFLLIAPAVLFIELARPPKINPSPARLLTFWLAWLVLAAAIPLFVFNGPLASLGIGGLVQRLYWLAVALWLLFKARTLI